MLGFLMSTPGMNTEQPPITDCRLRGSPKGHCGRCISTSAMPCACFAIITKPDIGDGKHSKIRPVATKGRALQTNVSNQTHGP